jgi:hypothetical protein
MSPKYSSWLHSFYLHAMNQKLVLLRELLPAPRGKKGIGLR